MGFRFVGFRCVCSVFLMGCLVSGVRSIFDVFGFVGRIGLVGFVPFVEIVWYCLFIFGFSGILVSLPSNLRLVSCIGSVFRVRFLF